MPPSAESWPSISAKSSATSSQAMPWDVSQDLTVGSPTTSQNSWKSISPSLLLSASVKSSSILLAWVRADLSLRFIIMKSSELATSKVSCKKTPLTTPTTATPMVSLWITHSSMNHSVTFSESTRQTGGQFPSVTSNIDIMARVNVPKYSYTSCRLFSGMLESWKKVSKRIWLTQAAMIACSTKRNALDQKKIPRHAFKAVTTK
mmetsp:Transcript_36759/g.101100  ORF Transcript_36759/g.101100 Transcript_36759/m.101100 type:complete len:204 (+) Transcript_36759:817-1428(+)